MAYTTIDDPSKYFQTKIYTGTNNELVLTFDGNSDMQPDMIWTKNRGRVANHVLSDTVRGIGKGLYPDLTSAEGDTNYISAIGSDGYTIVATDSVEINRDDDTFVSWNWKEQAGVFDIVSYTGNGSNRTIAHNLGVVPKMMIVKRRDASASWFVYHVANGNGNVMKLDNNEAVSAYAEYWNSTTPTSSVFSLGTAATANADGGTFIAYLFGNKQGVSKMGSYTGNGNADGAFVYLGFKPAFVMWKRTDTTNNWMIGDNKITTFNPKDNMMRADLANVQLSTNPVDFLSNGFKIRLSGNAFNNSSGTYIYMAFAESPLVSSTGVPATAR
jgi:hypothetical protein